MATHSFDTEFYTTTSLIATVREFRGILKLELKKNITTGLLELHYNEDSTTPDNISETIIQAVSDNVLRENLDANFRLMREQIVNCAFSAIRTK